MFFSRMLGVEINDSYVCMGYLRGRRLAGFARVEMSAPDGTGFDAPPLRKIIDGYRSAHRCGRYAALTVNTAQAVTRFVKVPETGRRLFFAPSPKPDLTGAFPVDTEGYAVDFRQAGEGSALACGIPAELSRRAAKLFEDMRVTPLRLDVYVNSVSLALERAGGNAICVADTGVICVAEGVLTAIITPSGERELSAAIDGMGPAEFSAYNPAGFKWADDMLSGAGARTDRGYDLGLRGLLEARP